MDVDTLIVGGGIAGASLGAEIAASRPTLIAEAEAHCGYHSTGRSAAFFLESYGGPDVARLNAASFPFLSAPPAELGEASFLRARGALHISDGTTAPHWPSGSGLRAVDRTELGSWLPGLRPKWRVGLFEPSCADIDVARLHGAFLRLFRSMGGQVRTNACVASAIRMGSQWRVQFEDGQFLTVKTLVNAAGAWSDEVAVRAGVDPIGIQPKRRTMVQLRVGKGGLKDLPLVIDAAETFYFKGEGDRTIWLSPHDEIDCAPCDAAPEEVDVALAIHRFQDVVDWPVEAVERRWAGLRSFSPDRRPVYGFDPSAEGFFWCAGQGGFGIQSCVAAARLAASELTGDPPHRSLAGVDPERFAPGRFR